MFSKAFFGRKQELTSLIALTVASIVTTTCCLSKYLHSSVCVELRRAAQELISSVSAILQICCTKPGCHSFLPVFYGCLRRADYCGHFGTPSLPHGGRPKENAWTSLSLAPRNLPNLQSSLQVFINRPLSYELQTGIVSPLFTVVETKAERLPTCLRSQEELVTESKRALGFLTQAVGSHL